MNGYKVRYRGGPQRGRIEMLQNDPPLQFPPLRVSSIPRGSLNDIYRRNHLNPAWARAKTTIGCYSRVYTPMKDGSLLYVWVPQ